MFQPLDRTGQAAPLRLNSTEKKLPANLIEAHDWMGPDNVSDSVHSLLARESTHSATLKT